MPFVLGGGGGRWGMGAAVGRGVMRPEPDHPVIIGTRSHQKSAVGPLRHDHLSGLLCPTQCVPTIPSSSLVGAGVSGGAVERVGNGTLG